MRTETLMLNDRDVLAMAEAIQTEIELDDRMNAKVRDFNSIELEVIRKAKLVRAFLAD